MPSMGFKRQLLKQLGDFLEKEKPDLCCFAEIEKNDFSAEIQQMLAKYPQNDIQNKYHPNGFLQNFKAFRAKGNGFFAKDVNKVSHHYFSCGIKRLIYEITLPNGVTVFMAHFSLLARVRKKQLRDMAKLVSQKENVVVCGDFNIFEGFSELDEFLRKTNLKIFNRQNEHTFPRAKPKKTLSIFLGSSKISDPNIRVIRNLPISDHLPVMLDFVCTGPRENVVLML